jgi:transposase
MARREELNDKQWEIIEPLIPQPAKRDDGKGRPRRDDREILNGILWILPSGARWQDMPPRFPPYPDVPPPLPGVGVSRVLRQMLEALAEDLRSRGKLDLAECFIDATFVAAKKGGCRWQDQVGQGYEVHGSGRPRWFSCRHLRDVC